MAKRVINFNDYIGGEEALQIAARALRSLGKDVTNLSKTVGDDSGRIAAGFATIKQGIADIQSKAGKLQLFSGEDKAVLTALAQQLGELKKRQEDYKATVAAQKVVQQGLTETAKQYTSELAKQKDALKAAALAGDVEGQKKAAAAIRQTTQETTQLSKALRGANSEFTAAKGSYDALVIENNKLLASLHSLEGGLMSGSQEALKLKKQIYDNTQTLKDFDAETNRNFRSVGDYAKGFSGLVAELAKARSAQAGLTAGSEEYNRAQIRITGFQTAAQKSAAQMGLSYEQAEAKINGVAQAIQPLTTDLVRLEKEQQQVAKTAGEESVQYQKLGFQIQSAKTKIDEVATATAKAGEVQESFGKQLGFSKEGLNDYLTQLAVGAIGLQALVQASGAAFQANVEYSRNLAEVRKTTGLTADEAERLAQSLENLDTPTNLAGLLKIASVGGQLGIAKEDLLEFTKAIDTAVQALGNDFGGGAEAAEQIATTLGKISTVFGKELGTDVAQNILKIGSAVNQLGSEGAATAPFLTDVAQRVGGIATQSGLGLKDVLAYAAVLQETGSTAEVAGSSLGRLFSTLSTKTKAAFEIAQKANPALTLKEYTRLVNTDFNSAIQLFLKGLNAGNASTTEVAKRLGTLKLESGEARTAILTLAQSTDLFAQRQATANTQLNEATSLAKEAAVNVENLAGSVDELKNEAGELVTSGFLSSIFKGIVDIVKLDFKLFNAAFRGIGDAAEYVGQKLGILNKPLTDYTAKTVESALATIKQTAAQEKLLNAYTALGNVTQRSAEQEQEYAALRTKLLQEFGTAETKEVLNSIARNKEKVEDTKNTLRLEIKNFSDGIEDAGQKFARAQDAISVQLAGKTAEQIAAIRAVAKARAESAGRGTTVSGDSLIPQAQINAADRLNKAEELLKSQQILRSQAVAALAKLEGTNTAAKLAGADAAGVEEEAELQLDRTRQELAKNRAASLRDELADNAERLKLLRAYQAQQGKLFEDGQISPEILAERVRGSEDLATQIQRDGAAIRIKIAKAEAAERLAEAENDRIRQSKKKNISEEELKDIQGQYAARRVEIFRKEARDIAQAQSDLRKQLEVEPLEFKVATVDFNKLRADLIGYVKTYESELESLKNAEMARDSELTGALARREISQNTYDQQQRKNRKDTDEAILALDKKYHKATLEDQKKANQDALDDQEAAVAKRIALIEKIGQFTSAAESAFFGVKGNYIDADIQRTQQAYDSEIQAAGANSALKLQIQQKYDKQLRKLNYDKAKAERDQAAISVAISTAVAVGKSLATYGLPAAIPFIIGDLIIGGLQEAVILTKPLPAYFKGRKSGPAELAQVSERGPELIHEKASNRFRYVAEQAVVQLGEGDKVFTAHETTAMLATVGLNHSQAQQPARVAQAFSGAAQGAATARETQEGRGYSKLAANIDANTAALRKLKPTTVKVYRGADADVETSQGLTRYLTQRRFGKQG